MNSPLFNEITIKRLSQSIQITDEQKLAADRWISFLESDSLKKEKQSYIEFANTILKNILNYNIGLEELKHEEDFLEFSFRDKSGKKKILFETKGTKTKDLTANQYRRNLSQKTPLLQTWDYMSQLVIPYGVATNYKDFILLDFSKGYRKFHKFDFLSIKNNMIN